MKRLASALMSLMLLTAVAPATAEPGAFAGVDQLAEADWIVMHGRHEATMYFAFGIRSITDAGLETIGIVGKGKCHVERGKQFVMITCQGTGRGRPLAMDQLQFDPALRSASMSFGSGRNKHRVRWEGRGQIPWTGGQVVGGDGFAGAAAAMTRLARTNARLFGQRMPRRGGGFSFAGLAQGASAIVWLEGRNLTISPDGSYSYDVRFKIPH